MLPSHWPRGDLGGFPGRYRGGQRTPSGPSPAPPRPEIGSVPLPLLHLSKPYSPFEVQAKPEPRCAPCPFPEPPPPSISTVRHITEVHTPPQRCFRPGDEVPHPESLPSPLRTQRSTGLGKSSEVSSPSRQTDVLTGPGVHRTWGCRPSGSSKQTHALEWGHVPNVCQLVKAKCLEEDRHATGRPRTNRK